MIGIYCITNKVNNKKYVGQSWRIEQRFKEHVYKCCNAHLASAFVKYGISNFHFGVIETINENVTQQELDSLEADYIISSNLTDPRYGYNMRFGGSRGKHNKQSKAKLSLATKGRKLSEEHKSKIVIPLIGRYYSEETRYKIGIAHKGKIVSKETREKLRLSHLGKKQKQESIDKMVATQKALDSIRVEMSKVYDKYALDGILTKAQMTQYNRLATLEKNILSIMNPATRKAIKIIDKLRPEEYGEAFFRTAWAVDNNTGVGLSFGALKKETVLANLDNPFYTNAKNITILMQNPQFKNAINNGLALGQSYPQMMADLKKTINKKNFEIMRVLRTELHSSQEAGTSAAYQDILDQGIKGKVIWIATSDERTRDTHAQMDGVAKDDDGYYRGAIGQAEYPGDPNLPPEERINCRCSERFELEGIEPVGGYVNSNQSYEAWKEQYKTFK